MKQILFLLIILVQTGAYSFAQIGETTPEAKAKAMVSKIHKACNLQGSEWTKVNDAFTAYYKKVAALSTEKVVADAKIKELKKELNDKLTTSVSAERMRIWVAYKEKEKIQE